MIPFTADQFHGVFSTYNTAVWPAQWMLVALGMAAVVLALIRWRWTGVVVSAIPRSPRSPLIIPLLWCLVGSQAAFLFGVWPDLGLVVAAAVCIGLLLTAGGQRQTSTA